MAISVGTNCGFVSSAPSGDPGGTTNSGLMNNACLCVRDTSPAGTKIITEIGWWQVVTNNSQCDFNVGVYSNGSAKPSALITAQSSGLYVPANTAGWAKYTGLSISISASTAYWIAIGCADVATDLRGTRGTASGFNCAYNTITGPTLSDPWSSTGEGFLSNYMWAIYAKYEDAASGLSIPVAQSIYRKRRL